MFQASGFTSSKVSKLLSSVFQSFEAPRPQDFKGFKVQVSGSGTRVPKNNFFVKSLGARNYFRVAGSNVPTQEFQVPRFAGGFLGRKFEGSRAGSTL